MRLRTVFRLIFLGVLVFATGCGAIVYSGLHDDLHKADVGVVLGSMVNPDGTPSEGLQARLDHALYLYNQLYYRAIFVSGGHGIEGWDEGTVMRDFLVKNGVPSSAITVDNAGDTTRATAQNVAHFLEKEHLDSVVIVSQYYHLPRCRLAFSQAGVKNIYTSHAPDFSPRDFYSIPREVIGYAAYLALK